MCGSRGVGGNSVGESWCGRASVRCVRGSCDVPEWQCVALQYIGIVLWGCCGVWQLWFGVVALWGSC